MKNLRVMEVIRTTSLFLYHDIYDLVALMTIDEYGTSHLCTIELENGESMTSDTTTPSKWVENGWTVIGEL